MTTWINSPLISLVQVWRYEHKVACEQDNIWANTTIMILVAEEETTDFPSLAVFVSLSLRWDDWLEKRGRERYRGIEF